MKISSLKTIGMGVLFTVVCVSARASVVEGAGNWKGTGASFAIDGEKIADFAVQLTNTKVDDHTLLTSGSVTLADGSVRSFSQTMKDGLNGFSLESAEGTGGGHCFGAGLCESYMDLGNGHGVAVTEIFDGSSDMRLLAITIENGKGTGFTRENIHRY